MSSTTAFHIVQDLAKVAIKVLNDSSLKWEYPELYDEMKDRVVYLSNLEFDK